MDRDVSSIKTGDLVKRWSVGLRPGQSVIGLIIDERKAPQHPSDTVKHDLREMLVTFAPGDEEWILETILGVILDSPQ